MGNSPSQSGFHPPPQNATVPPRPPSGQQNATGSLNSNNNRNLSSDTDATMKNLDTNYDQSSPRPNFSLSSLADRNFSWTPTSKTSQLEQGPHSIDSLLVVDTNFTSTRTGDFSPSSLSPVNKEEEIMKKRCPLQFQCQHSSRDNNYDGAGMMVQSGYEVRDDNDVLTNFYDDSLELLPQPEEDIQTDSILIQKEKRDNVEEKVDNIDKETLNLDVVDISKPENPLDQNEPIENATNNSSIETIMHGSPSSSGFISDLDPSSLVTTIPTRLTQQEICPLNNKMPPSSPCSSLSTPTLVRDDENVMMIDELHQSQDSNRQHDVSSAPIITQTPTPPQLAAYPEVQQVQLQQQVQQSKLRESEPETKLFLINSTSNEEEDEKKNNNASINLINLDHDIIHDEIHKESILPNQEVVKDKYISVVQIMTDENVTTTITNVDEEEDVDDKQQHPNINTSPQPKPHDNYVIPADPTIFTEINLDQDSDNEDAIHAIPIPSTKTKPPLLESESLHEFESLEELVKNHERISTTPDNNYVTFVPVNYTSAGSSSLGLIIPCNPPAEFQTQSVETKEEEGIVPSPSSHLNSDDNNCSSSNSGITTTTTTTTINKRKVQFASEMTSPSHHHHHSAGATAAVVPTRISPIIHTSSRKQQAAKNCHLLPHKNSKVVNKSPPSVKSDMNFLGLFGNKDVKKVHPETATPAEASLAGLCTPPPLPQGDESSLTSSERGGGSSFSVAHNSWSGGTDIHTNSSSSLLASRSLESRNSCESGDQGQDAELLLLRKEKTDECSRIFNENVCSGRDFALLLQNHYPEEGGFITFSPPPAEPQRHKRTPLNCKTVSPEQAPDESFVDIDYERFEEQVRLGEQRKREEQNRLDEQIRLDEENRLEEKNRLEEQNRLDEQNRVEEQNRLEEQKRLAKEKRFAENSRVIAEYEKTLAMYSEKIEDLKRELEQSNKDRCLLIKERDLAIEDLSNVESAFSDVHRKYERSKGILRNLKENEAQLTAHEQELVQKIENRDKKLSLYKEKAQEKLEQMYQDYEHKMKDVETENTRLRAQCRLLDMKLATLENDVEQKAKENSQLNALCNELIAGQGASNNN